MTNMAVSEGGHSAIHEATDYVPVNILDDYVADARTRWQVVTVGGVHDAGPAGASTNGNSIGV